MKLEKFDKAVQVTEKAIEFDKKNAKSHYRRGMGLAGQRNIEPAIEALKEALHLAPNDTSIRAELERLIEANQQSEQKAKQEMKEKMKGAL